MTKAPPPLSPASVGKRQILPSPTAAPTAARINALREDQPSPVEVVVATMFRLFLSNRGDPCSRVTSAS